jgi:hypothetical protein
MKKFVIYILLLLLLGNLNKPTEVDPTGQRGYTIVVGKSPGKRTLRRQPDMERNY